MLCCFQTDWDIATMFGTCFRPNLHINNFIWWTQLTVVLLSVNDAHIFFIAVPPHWCKLRRTLEVMLVMLTVVCFKNELTNTCGYGKVETGLFLCSGLQHIDLWQVTVWLEKVWSWEAELILLCLISLVCLEQVAYTLTLSVVNYLQFTWSTFLFLSCNWRTFTIPPLHPWRSA
jgi:hypothetical protein